jgi:peptide deformylase
VTVREIREVPDPVLRTKCEPVTDIDDGVRNLIADLLDTVDEDGRAGLAANQIGVNLTAFAWNIADEVGYVINPRIVELSEEKVQEEEGCLSVPGLWYPTTRANFARVEGINLDGEPVSVAGTGLMARCLQHECDHLEGKLYLDRLEREVRARAMKELRERL